MTNNTRKMKGGGITNANLKRVTNFKYHYRGAKAFGRNNTRALHHARTQLAKAAKNAHEAVERAEEIERSVTAARVAWEAGASARAASLLAKTAKKQRAKNSAVASTQAAHNAVKVSGTRSRHPPARYGQGGGTRKLY